MIQSLRFPFWPALIAAALSAASAHAQGKQVAAAVDSAASKKSAAASTAATAPKAAPPCNPSAQFGRLDQPLTHTARLIAAGMPIKIVAIGSSSTAGAGASSPDASYPSRLAVELSKRFPANKITVLNRGVNGEEGRDMLARFDKAVIAEKPDLVLWQLGTNAVLRDQAPSPPVIEKGVSQLKAAGADVILIDPQFAPKVLAKGTVARMLDMLAFKAKQFNVNLFHRFDLMRDWREREGMPFTAFVSPDQLHMNDWSYACVAKVLGAAIAEAATRPVASAAAAPAR